MSNVNCNACSDLAEYASSFVVNGVTSTVATSLRNDTGLNPNLSSLHKNCPDLLDVNDCLVGKMAGDVEAYDVCEWKEYMHDLVDNLYETNKAIINSGCGAWSNIHDIEDSIEGLCELIDNVMSPPIRKYGILPNSDAEARKCGTIGRRDGNLLMIKMDDSDVSTPSAMNVGVRFGSQKVYACSGGRCKLYEWLAPDFYGYQISSAAQVGDIVWYCTENQAKNIIGVSDHIWNDILPTGFTWRTYPLADHRYGWFQVQRSDDNRLCVIFQGTSYPNVEGEGSVPFTRNLRVLMPDNPEELFKSFC